MKSTFQYNEASWSVLALVRFVLAFIVMAAHLKLYWFGDTLPALLNIIASCGGKAAVIGFLFISGVSIGHSYSKQPKDFYKRRFLRIYPLYFTAILLTAILQHIIGSPFQVTYLTFISAGCFTTIANLFFLQGMFAIVITYNPPLWSISVEMFYYVLAPILNKLKTSVLILLMAVSICMFYCFYLKDFLWGFVFIKYLWAWLIGFIFSMRKQNFLFFLILFSLSALITQKVLWVKNIHEGVFSGLTVFIVGLLILSVNNKHLKIPNHVQSIFNFLGELSYPIYLFHIPLFMIFYRFIGITNSFIFILLAIISVIPINLFFDRFLKRSFWKPFADYVSHFFKRQNLKPIV